MKNIIISTIWFIVLSLFLAGCSTPKFYTEIHSLKEKARIEINNQTNELNEVIIKEPDINKLVLKKLELELKKTNELIYYYSHDSSFYSGKIWIIVFDADNKIYYQLETNNINTNKINLIKKTDFLEDNYSSFIFKNFIGNNCEILKNKGKEKISGVRTFEEVYYVNLKTKESNSCIFKNFILID